MTDKVQKIREEVARIQLYTQSEVLKQVLDYIDEVQKEPVSIWHDANEEPNNMSHCLVFYGDKSLIGHYLHYEPVLYNKQDKVFVTVAYPHQTGYKVEQKSLDGGCVAEVYKDKRDRISISDITSWCYLNDLHNFTQKEEPAIEDLGEYINELSKQFPEVSFAKLSRIAVRVAKWQQERDEADRAAVYKCGWNDRKAMMMKKSFDAKILPTNIEETEFCLDDYEEVAIITEMVNKGEFKMGDKVKVNVIKED